MTGATTRANTYIRPDIVVDVHAPDARLVSWGVRVVAKLIDVALVWGVFTVLWFVAAYFMDSGQEGLGWTFYAITIAQGVAGWGWIIYDTGATGQSIGKRIMRTRKLNRIGRPMGLWHALVHEVVQLFVDMLPLFLGYLWPLFNAPKQTFTDKLMHTQTLHAAGPQQPS